MERGARTATISAGTSQRSSRDRRHDPHRTERWHSSSAVENDFVHRSRTLERKDGSSLNEVRVLCTSLTSNGGTLEADRQIKLDRADRSSAIRDHPRNTLAHGPETDHQG